MEKLIKVKMLNYLGSMLHMFINFRGKQFIRVFGKVSIEKGYQLVNPKFEKFQENFTKFTGISAYPLRRIFQANICSNCK